MRVWALASCGGLLALTACSAEQSTAPNSEGLIDGDEAAQVKAQPEPMATPFSPAARPEVSPRQILGGRRPLVRSARQVKGAEVSTEERILSQSAHLRARLQRLQAQRGSRLAPNTQAVAIPLPAPLPAGTSQPQLSTSQVNISTKQPAPSAASNAAPPGASASSVRALPLQPLPSRPSRAAEDAPGGAATDLGQLAAANGQRSPIVPLRHQGYSTRFQQQVPVLTVPPTNLARGETAAIATIAPRLHGEDPSLLQAQPGVVAASPQPAGRPQSTTASRASQLVDASRASQPVDGGAHQTGNATAVTVVPTAAPTGRASRSHHRQVTAPRQESPLGISPALSRPLARTGTAIAPPASLPLNPPAPGLRLPRAAESAPSGLPQSQPAPSPALSRVADPATVQPATDGASLAGEQPADPAAPSVQPLDQLQSQPEFSGASSSISPQDRLAACLLTNAMAPTPEIDAAVAPQFSRAGVADTTLAPKADLGKDAFIPDHCAGGELPAANLDPAPNPGLND